MMGSPLLQVLRETAVCRVRAIWCGAAKASDKILMRACQIVEVSERFLIQRNPPEAARPPYGPEAKSVSMGVCDNGFHPAFPFLWAGWIRAAVLVAPSRTPRLTMESPSHGSRTLSSGGSPTGQFEPGPTCPNIRPTTPERQTSKAIKRSSMGQRRMAMLRGVP